MKLVIATLSQRCGIAGRGLLISVFLVLFASTAWVGCGEDKGSETDNVASSDAGAAGDGASGFPTPDLGGPCVSSDDCPGQVCDKRHGACVDCYLTSQCSDDTVCSYGSCVTPPSCANGRCDQGVCSADGYCVDCSEDSHCAPGLVCTEGVCRPAAEECTSASDCAATGSVCLDTGICGDCSDDTACGDYEYCEDGQCVPELCIPAQAYCVGNVVQVCRRDGQGYSQILCDEGQTCHAGECVQDECEPNTVVCDKYQLRECTADGQLLTKECPPGQECIDNDCAPMRHRVLVVFDTSNSMNWLPGVDDRISLCGAGETEGCLEPWPVCEGCFEPMTRLGLAKKVFKQFFQSSEADEVLFALQRFPQVADKQTALCEGGYMTANNAMTGDDGSFWTPFELQTYFDDNLGEAIAVQFPPTLMDSNIYDLVRWVDCKEEVEKTDQPCATDSDCPNGFCKGTAGNKFCRQWSNPEIRADGWTPLGKSLFYAGEYMRRRVVLDGKPCGSDGDCPSPGYYCSEGGKCFDPLRQCRLNVVVAFTDGEDTVNQFENDFFNPVVQAKRLRLGLGCETTEDCSQVSQCITSEQSDLDGCHEVSCTESGYCTNYLHETQQTTPVSLGLTGMHINRLVDWNGNPIEVITHVVDASGPNSENNRRIALNGGGLHLVVDVEDPPEFLASLKQTIDFKTLFQQCGERQTGSD